MILVNRLTIHCRVDVLLGVLAVLALALSLDGCAALQPAPEPNVHLLLATPLTHIARAKRELVLEVTALRAWPGFDTLQMAYVQRPYELDYFATARWADAPAHMLGPLLAQALQQTESFRAVVQTPSAVPADIRVNAELIRLQQDFTTHPSQVELSLRVELIDVRAKRVLATRLFDATEPALTENASGGVAAANVAVQRVLEQVADFCVAESAR
jgi:cholesterol transport system auxiliary component